MIRSIACSENRDCTATGFYLTLYKSVLYPYTLKSDSFEISSEQN